MKFLHAADLHLGMRITRFSAESIDRVREARFAALEHIRDEARKSSEGYRFVILAGDLFDDVRVKRTIAERAYSLLSSFPVPVLVVSGNHDPFEPGSVWDSAPWNHSAGVVRVLRERRPFTELPGVTVYPCPVYRKTSTENPTQWIIDQRGNGQDGIRIGIAHGSVMDRPTLPPNDHPIPATAPHEAGLDYLALGHWHKTRIFADGDGHSRMAYCGVHEPMRFGGDPVSSGWRPYSGGADRDEFFDDGCGTVLSVTIDAPRSPPIVQPIAVGHFRWVDRSETISSEEQLDRLLSDVAEAPRSELTLLRLRLIGTLPLQAMQRVDELREILSGRYAVGQLDDSGLLVEPTADEIRDVVGGGVLRAAYDRLHTSLANGNGHDRAVPERALRVLYQLARQVRDRS